MQEGVITEADTCREFVTPRLIKAGWSASPHAIGEQRTFTNGWIIVAGGQVRRGKQKRADYLLYFRSDCPLAVVEAKEFSLPAECSVQQARDNAEVLGLKFAYATNDHRIIEIDYITGTEQEVERYATPAESFARLTAAAQLPASSTAHLLERFNLVSGTVPRYYQQIAIHRMIEAILLGQKRILATLASGTGRTWIAFQLCWKLWNLIIIDECHRGSSRDESRWRAVLVEDGFLAPYRVHRVITTVDAAGWRPSKDEMARYGREVPDDEYQTKDFERVIALRSRTRAMAKHLTDFLKGTDRFAKTLIFCVDPEHAAEMRQELLNLNSDLVKNHPDYVCRVTADEGAIGLTHLSHFQDVDKPTPVSLTTLQLLTTGVDAEMVKNVVLARVVGSRSEFKQIVERGIIQFHTLSDLMKVQPFDRFGSPPEIANRYFGGVKGLKEAVSRLQTAIYQYDQRRALQRASLYGQEAKPLPNMQTAETALLFQQYIMRKQRVSGFGAERGSRAAMVAPNGTLFGDGVCAVIKEEMLNRSEKTHAKAGLEHADPKDLIARMRGHEAKVMRLLGEIDVLVNEVQA